MLIEHEVSPGDIWRACQTKDVPIRDWVKLAVTRARATGSPTIFWLDETRAHDANLIAKVNEYLPAGRRRGRHRGSRHPDPEARGRDQVLDRPDPQGRGHHLGDRQRAPRLPDRPVPDPRARHQREDALRRTPDQRRWPVRDRRRRLGAQARAAAAQGELPALGQPRRVPRAGRELRASTPRSPATRTPRCSARRSTGRPAPGSTRTSRRGRKLGTIDNRGSHFYLALYWAQELGEADRRQRPGRGVRRAGREALGVPATRSPRSCSACRARRPTSAATTAPTPTRPPRSCAPPRPSTTIARLRSN